MPGSRAQAQHSMRPPARPLTSTMVLASFSTSSCAPAVRNPRQATLEPFLLLGGCLEAGAHWSWSTLLLPLMLSGCLPAGRRLGPPGRPPCTSLWDTPCSARGRGARRGGARLRRPRGAARWGASGLAWGEWQLGGNGCPCQGWRDPWRGSYRQPARRCPRQEECPAKVDSWSYLNVGSLPRVEKHRELPPCLGRGLAGLPLVYLAPV